MELPEGMEWIDPRVTPKAKVRLLKSLYGLKQSPRLWYQTINAFLLSLGLDQSSADSNLYITNGALVLLYVDDTSVFDTSDPGSKEAGTVASRIMTALKSEYKMSDLGPIQRFLGMDVRHTENGLTLDQETYIDTMVRKYNLQDARRCYSPLDPNVRLENGECEDRPADKQVYQSLIGSLMYAALGTRPDISFAVAALSKYNSSPLTTHMTAAIRVLRYLKTTAHFRLHFENSGPLLDGFTDSDWAGCRATRKSVGGHIFLIGGSPVSWQAKGQTVVALSTLEAELIACSDGTREALWLKRLLSDLGAIGSGYSVPIHCDNQGALKLIHSGVFKAKTKHIAIKHLHAHDEQEKGNVRFTYIESEKNLADILTKALPRPRHQTLTDMMTLSGRKENLTELGKRG